MATANVNYDESLVASKVAFNQLCQLLERMHKASTNAARKSEFEKFVAKWVEIHENLHKSKPTKDSFFPVLRLILPQLERERPSYGIKEIALAKIYVQVFGLSKNSPDATKILHYKNPKSKNTGDFADIAFTHVLSKRCPSSGIYTIKEINDVLDRIAHCSNQGQKSLLHKTFVAAVQNMSAVEQKWLARIILKDNKLKIGNNAILNAFHPDAEDLYNITTSLREVCEKLRCKDVRLSDIEITLFQPFRPMLAEIAKITDVEKLMNHKEFRVEIKYDGERSQLHKDGSQYKYFSRSGREYSTVFGDNPYSGSLTPFIHSKFNQSVKSCILDGEMMGFDPELKAFVQKGAQFDIKHITQDSDLQPCFVAYDILLLNGETLASKPLQERLEKLNETFTSTPGRMQYAEKWNCTTNGEVVKLLNDAVDRHEEGIMVKSTAALYTPNQRKASGWIKIKPEYATGMVDDMDVVVVGGKFGSDRFANMITKFLLAVCVKNAQDETPEKFKTFAYVGSGFTNRQLYKVMEIIKPHLELFVKKNPPKWLEFSKEKPEVIIHPKNSVVLQIKATEIITSNAYATKCTLRFPRVTFHRDDKTYRDALDEKQLLQLQKMAEGKLTARHASLTAENQPPAKRRKSQRLAAVPTVSSKFTSDNTVKVSSISSIFADKEICVISGNTEHSKRELEKYVVENGGVIVQNPSRKTFCIIARDMNHVRVKNAMKTKKYDIVKLQWLVRCCENKNLLSFSPFDILFITETKQAELNKLYGKFGDDHVTVLNSELLKSIFDRVSIPIAQQDPLQSCINELYREYEQFELHNNPGCIFHNLNIYVVNNHRVANEIISLLSFYGGTVSDAVLHDTTHVVVAENTEDILNELFAKRRESHVKFHIVSPKWVFKSLLHKSIQNERHYAINLRFSKR